jgi:hypothetical protein
MLTNAGVNDHLPAVAALVLAVAASFELIEEPIEVKIAHVFSSCAAAEAGCVNPFTQTIIASPSHLQHLLPHPFFG